MPKSSPIKQIGTIPTSPFLPYLVRREMRKDYVQEGINERMTDESSNISENQLFSMDNIVYSKKDLEQSALKYNMDFKEYMRKMYDKGMDIYTTNEATDEEIETKTNTIIDRQENSLYNKDLSEEEVVKLEELGVVYSPETRQDVGRVYETEDGKKRRTRGTLNSEEIKQMAGQTYMELMSSDEYFQNYDDNWVKNNQTFIDQQIQVLQNKYDVSTEEGIKKANEELSSIVGNKIQEHAEVDEEYAARIAKYDKIIGERYGKQLYFADLVSDREKLIDEEFSSGIYKALPDLAKWFKMGVWQLMAGKDKTDWGIESARLKNVNDFLENPSYGTVGYGAEPTYNFNGTYNQRQGVTTYERSFKTEEEAKAWATEEAARLEKSRVENLVLSNEYQRKIELLGAPEFFNEDLDFEWDIDTYQRVLGTQGFQMLAAIPSFGASTFYQEAGGMLTGMTLHHASKLAFPELETEEAINKYMDLSDEEQIKWANEAFDSGLVNYDDAITGGFQNAGYDFVSNFFTFFKAGKAVKFLPKAFANLATRNTWKEAVKYSWKSLIKPAIIDGSKAMGLEVATENAQELTSKYYIDKNTIGDGLQQTFHKYFVEDQRGLLETSVQSAVVPGTLVGGSRVIGTGYKLTNSMIADLYAMKDPKHLRNYANKRLDVLKKQLEEGTLSEQQYADEVIALETAVESVSDSKNKYLKGKTADQVLGAEISNAKIQKEREQLLEDNKEHFKDRENKKQGRKSNLELKLQELNDKIADNNLLIVKERLKANIEKTRPFLSWINKQKEGIFKDKKAFSFKTIKAAKKWVDGRKKYLTGAIKKTKGERKTKLQNELKELNNDKALNKIFGLDKNKTKNNGVNLGNLAIIIEENIKNNIDKSNYGANLGAANTFHHEGLHYITDGLSIQELKFLEKEISPFITGNLKKLLNQKYKQYKKIYNKAVVDGRMSKEEADLAIAREYLTSLSDAMRVITESNFEQDGVLQRGLDKIGEVIEKVIRKAAPDLEFDMSQMTGIEAYQFLKKYNDFNGKRRINLKLPKLKNIPRPSSEIEDDANKFSITVSDEVQDIYNKQELGWQFEILDLYRPMAIKIAGKYSNVPGFNEYRDILIDEILTGERGVLDLINAYDPETGVPLAAYVNKYIASRAIEIANRILKQEFTSDITETRGIAAAEESSDIVVETKESTLKEGLGLNEDIINEIKDAVTKTFGIRLPQIGSKEFKKVLQDNYRNALFKIIKNFVGTRAKYKSFLEKNWKLIYDAIPQSTVNKRFPAWAVPVLDENGKQLREKTAQGNAVFTKKEITQEEFVNYFLGDNVGPSTKGTRKDALVESLSEELAFDATMEVIQQEDVAKKFNAVNEIQGFTLPDNYLAILDRDIDRDRNAKFSITVDTMPEGLQGVFTADRKKFFNNINRLGHDKKSIGLALDKAFGKGFFGTHRQGIIDDFYKKLKIYSEAQKKYKEMGKKLPMTLSEYISVSDSKLDEGIVLSKMFGLKNGMADIFRNENNVESQRKYVANFAEYLKEKGYKSKDIIKDFYTWQGAFQDSTGRGKRAMIFDDVNDFIDFLNSIDEEVTVVAGKKKGEIEIDGIVFKPERPSSVVQSGHLNRKKNRDLEALRSKKAEEFVVKMFEYMRDQKSEQFTNVNQAMMVAGLLGNMKGPLRAAADWRYISTVLPNGTVLKSLNEKTGKLEANYRYEHLIPARYMAFVLSDHYLLGNNLKTTNKDIKTLLDDYSVAIIPVSMDSAIGSMFGNTMNIDYFIGQHPSRRYYNIFTRGEVQFAIRDLKNPDKIYGEKYANEYPALQKLKKDNAKFSIYVDENQSLNEQIETYQDMEAALEVARDLNAERKGISVFDFDDTIAISNSKVGVTMLDGSTRRISATEFALESVDLETAGAVFDFSEFNKVIDGKKGPLADLALRRQDKFTSKDIFILTARPQEAAPAIKRFLDSIGIKIPLKNIVGLEDGKPIAKARWVLKKAAEGYNDFYFADDQIKNVKAVKEILDVVDVKSKVQQAKFSIKVDLENEMNNIIEEESGVRSETRYSRAAAKREGARKRAKWKWFIPPSAEDFVGLLYDFLSRGAKGERQMAFFDKYLLKPFNRAYRDIATAKQAIINSYKALKKDYKDVSKKMGKDSGYKNFTYGHAVRVYLWDKFGMKIPGLSKTDQAALVRIVKKDPQMMDFADNVAKVTNLKEGYVEPDNNWLAGNLEKDMMDVVDRVLRKKYLKEFLDNVQQIFSKDVLNKVEAIYGTAFADAIKDILYRMEHGTNRQQGTNKIVNSFMNWVNNSVGAIMFMHVRSALLQTISMINFINLTDNNMLKAGLAFANQKQFWSDFVMIFNSPTLKQRRRGLQTDINEAEIANAAANSQDKASAILAYLLKVGFTPTQIADSFAISMGGASFYRNRVNTYKKQGLDQKTAESRAFDDFLETSEKSQQSARPDLISPIQASPLGRLIFAFQNTPMQYTRLIKKSIRDLAAGRGDAKTHISKILYYGFLQNMLFTGLQNAMFGMMFEDDEDESVEERYKKKQVRMVNNMVDTILRGSGLPGAILSTAKNAVMKFLEQEKKGWSADHTYTMIELVNLSPPIGSKLRKVYSGIQTYRFNKKIIGPMGFDLQNPAWDMVANWVSGITNVPMDKMLQLVDSAREATDRRNALWQRIAVALGWRTWDVNIIEEEVEEFKNMGKKKTTSKKKTKKKVTPKS